jgi:hypothetical protein
MFHFFASRTLFDAAGADGAAGGGDGAGAANSGAATFDAAAFKSELFGEFNKVLNGFAKTLKADVTKLVTPKQADTTTTADTSTADTSAQGNKSVDPEKNALALELKTLKASFNDKFKALEDAKLAADKKADEAERDSLIRAELGKYSFAPGKAAETAFAIVKAAVQRSEDGSLVAGDLPMAKFIETELPTNHPYLLAAKDLGSAGARPGKSAGGQKQFTMADLDPATFQKKTPAEQAEIRKQVFSALNLG